VDGGVERSGASLADLVRVNDLFELLQCGARRLEVAGSDGDLHLSREASNADERILDVVKEPCDAGDRGIDLALGETEEREARLRLAPELVRRAVRLLSTGEVAPPAPDLPDLVVPAGCDAAVEVVQLLTGRERLRFGRRPVAAEPQDLRPVDATCPWEARDVQLVAPPVRRFGPLCRAPVVAQIAAGADREAINETGRVRLQVAGYRGCCRLVQQSEALLDLPGFDARAPLPGESQYLHISVAHPLGELERVFEERLRAIEVTLREEGGHCGDQQGPGVLWRLGQTFEQPLGSREPAVRDGERAAALVVPGERERHPGRTPLVVGCRVRGVRTLAEADRLVELPRPPRRVGEALEVLGRQIEPVDPRVRVVGLAPRMARCCLPSRVQGADYLRHARPIVTPDLTVCTARTGSGRTRSSARQRSRKALPTTPA